MQAIIFTLVIIGTFASSRLEVAGDVPQSTGVVADEEVAKVLEATTAPYNETVVDVNGTTVAPALDLAHPIDAVEALYENSRERIHHWMEDTSYSHIMVLSALVGTLSAFTTLLLLYMFYSLFRKCRSKRRQHKIVDIVSQLNDGKNPFESKLGDSDDDII